MGMTGETTAGYAGADEAAAEAPGEAAAAGGSGEDIDALFPDDTGTLPAEVRVALSKLRHDRYVDAASDEDAYRAIVTNRELVESRLSDEYLSLHLDPAWKVAWAQRAACGADIGGGRPVKSPVPWGPYETLAVIALRQTLSQQYKSQPSWYISRDELTNAVVSGSDLKGELESEKVEKKIDGLVKRLREKGLIATVRGEAETYRIMPVVGALIPDSATAVELRKRIEAVAGGAASTDARAAE